LPRSKESGARPDPETPCATRDSAAARRLYTIASARKGVLRAEAARHAAMARRALRNAVVRHNVEGIASLHNHRHPSCSCKLSTAELRELAELIVAGPARNWACRAGPYRSCAAGSKDALYSARLLRHLVAG